MLLFSPCMLGFKSRGFLTTSSSKIVNGKEGRKENSSPPLSSIHHPSLPCGGDGGTLTSLVSLSVLSSFPLYRHCAAPFQCIVLFGEPQKRHRHDIHYSYSIFKNIPRESRTTWQPQVSVQVSFSTPAKKERDGSWRSGFRSAHAIYYYYYCTPTMYSVPYLIPSPATMLLNDGISSTMEHNRNIMAQVR